MAGDVDGCRVGRDARIAVQIRLLNGVGPGADTGEAVGAVQRCLGGDRCAIGVDQFHGGPANPGLVRILFAVAVCVLKDRSRHLALDKVPEIHDLAGTAGHRDVHRIGGGAGISGRVGLLKSIGARSDVAGKGVGTVPEGEGLLLHAIGPGHLHDRPADAGVVRVTGAVAIHILIYDSGYHPLPDISEVDDLTATALHADRHLVEGGARISFRVGLLDRVKTRIHIDKEIDPLVVCWGRLHGLSGVINQ